MSKYVLAFRGQPDRQPARDENEAWGTWLGGLGAKIVDPGNRVGQVERLNADPAGLAVVATAYDSTGTALATFSLPNASRVSGSRTSARTRSRAPT